MCVCVGVRGGEEEGEGAHPEFVGEKPFDPVETGLCRVAVARCNRLGADRLDISFPTKTITSGMEPHRKHFKVLIRMCRYLQ